MSMTNAPMAAEGEVRQGRGKHALPQWFVELGAESQDPETLGQGPGVQHVVPACRGRVCLFVNARVCYATRQSQGGYAVRSDGGNPERL